MVESIVTTIDGLRTASYTYQSLTEFADAAQTLESYDKYRSYDFVREQYAEALELARNGWSEHLDDTLSICESAVSLIEREHDVETFQPVWDVSGADVDVARYLNGEPENMIDYPLSATSKSGRVIALCASVCYSSIISQDTIVRRGQVICALAVALSRAGHSLELWADISTKGSGSMRGKACRVRVLVKGANDTLDPEGILYAYSNPSMLRRLGLAFMIATGDIRGFSGFSGSTSAPVAPLHDLPEGTIYLPEVSSYRDVPNAHTELKRLLSELGLLAE